MVGQHEYVFAAMSGRRPFYPMWFDVARQAYVRLMVWASLCFWVLACTCFLLMFELSELAFICFVLMFERHKTDIDYNIFRCRYPWRATRARKIDKGNEDIVAFMRLLNVSCEAARLRVLQQGRLGTILILSPQSATLSQIGFKAFHLALHFVAGAWLAEKIAIFETSSSFNLQFIIGDEDIVAFVRLLNVSCHIRDFTSGVEELDSNSDAYRETKLRTDLELIINMLAIPPAIYTIKKELFSFLHKGILSDEESK
ncbi:hypothetical protein Tco_0933080, partial [Tanacetum coccineum]